MEGGTAACSVAGGAGLDELRAAPFFCRFGVVVVGDTNGTCVAPDDDAAAAGYERTTADVEVYQHARLGGTDGQTLYLTEAGPRVKPAGGRGKAGHALLSMPLPEYDHPRGAEHAFRATFRLIIDPQGYGASFSYGDLSDEEEPPSGEWITESGEYVNIRDSAAQLAEGGGGNGLRVLFRSGRRWAGPRFTTLAATDRELSVVYMGETLARCALPQHPPDNGDPWHDVLISYQTEEEGGDVGLRVEFDRVPCVARLVLDHWRPQPSWRFGLAAASSEPDGVRHYVRRLVVRTGSRVQSSQIPLAVSPNAQQWSAPIDVTYTGPPTISALAPRTGPVDGGTLLALSGHALHGSRPLCRLADAGRAANASASFDVYGALRRSDGAIVCELPAAADLPPPLASARPLYVHLAPNGQQFTAEAPPFVWTDAEIGAAHPQSSPAAGGAALTIGLSGLNASAVAAIRDEGAARCDFYTNTTLDPPARPAVALDPPYAGGERPAGTRPAGTRPDGGDVSDHTSTPATVDADGATLRCATPRRPAGDVALRVSLNGQQLTAQAEHAPPLFAFHGRLFEHSVSKPPVALIPPGGPAAAQHNRSATLPLVFPVALAAGSVVRCRFGTAETDGVLISNGSATLDLSDLLDALLDAGAAAQDCTPWRTTGRAPNALASVRCGRRRPTARCRAPRAAGAAWELWLTFGTAADHADNWEGAREAAAAGGLELGGDAIIDVGQLRLTRAGDPVAFADGGRLGEPAAGARRRLQTSTTPPRPSYVVATKPSTATSPSRSATRCTARGRRC